jgi:two-component system, sensor histidine kinase and response regulator
MPERILVVDDSPTQLEAARALLEASGYDVRTARSGGEALDRVRSERIDLVLSDVVMPGMSGFELCRRIKGEAGAAAPPIVLLTSLTDPRDIVRGVECGADNYITKPYEPEHLLERIRHVLENQKLRAGSTADGPVSISFLGETYSIRSDPAQILALLLSSFEELIRTNAALQDSKRQLADAHARELKREQEARAKAEADTRRLELLKQKAEAATRMRDEVLATVSHDLKNPLGTIFTSASLLRDVPLDEQAQRRQIEIIGRTAERMDQLIGDLLDVSRMEAGRFTVDAAPERAHALIADAREMLLNLAQANDVQLVEDLDGDDVAVVADRGRVLQVFSNLIGNAIKFTPAGGTVTIRADRDGDAVRFSVADTGIGISEDDLPHIFDRFWYGGTGGGSGLGLAIAKGIVEAHGGRIGVRSSDHGSTFHFTLPCASRKESITA